MAEILKLVKIDEADYTDEDALSLLADTDGFCLARDGWVRAVPQTDEQTVAETITVHISSSGDDPLAATMQALADKRKEAAQYYNSSLERYPVVLRAKMTSESGILQSLVKRVEYTPPSLTGVPHTRLPNLIIGVERAAWWETTAAYSLTSSTGVSTFGGILDYTDNPGDLPARLERLTLELEQDSNISTIWMGIKTERYGNDLGNFGPHIVVSDGDFGSFSYDTTGGTSNPDSGYSDTTYDAYRAVCTFATQAGMKPRAHLMLADVTVSPEDMIGRYQVLLRAKVTSGTANVRIGTGTYFYFETDSSATELYSISKYNSRVEVASTSFKLFDVGIISIENISKYYSIVDNFTIVIDAERTSGIGNLHLDTLILIPIDEFAAYATGAIIADDFDFLMGENIGGDAYGISMTSGVPQKSATVNLSGGVPSGDGRIVIAGQSTTIAHLDKSVALKMEVFPRWEYLRGNDGVST